MAVARYKVTKPTPCPAGKRLIVNGAKKHENIYAFYT